MPVIPSRRRPDLYAVPAIRREQPIPVGAVFFFGFRPLKIVKAFGDDPAAPVICEELEWHNPSLPGQLCLWSADGVRKAMRDQTGEIKAAAGGVR